MNILAVDIGRQISWAMKCGNVRMLGSTAGLLGWLPIMIEAYTIDLAVFSAAQAKIFHGFRNGSRARLERALKTCDEQNVATKCLDAQGIKRFLRDYKAAGGADFENRLATKIFATLMVGENRSIAESVDIARLMRDRDERIADRFSVGVTA